MKNRKTEFLQSGPAFFKGSLAFTFMLVFLTDCSNDEVTAAAPAGAGDTNSAVINGMAFKTPNAYMFDLGKYSKSNSRNFLADLTNGSYNGSNYSQNTTTIISIDFNSSSQTELAEGEYHLNLDTDSNNIPVALPFTFSDAYAHVGLKYENGNLVGGSRHENIVAGTIMVKHASGKYEISYNLTFGNEISISGVYEGSLSYFLVS